MAKRLLMVDAGGAAVTSLLTGLVLAPGLLPTGLPEATLCWMAVVAALLCLFGLLTLAFRGRPARALRLLAVGNVAYGAATLALCLMYRQTLTLWGGLYFAGEIAILVALAAVEWRVARQDTGGQ